MESIYLIFDSLQGCVARGKFYSKDRDTKGMTVLYFVSIVVVVAGVFTRSLGVASLGVVCFILNYIYYAEELALYEQKRCPIAKHCLHSNKIYDSFCYF